jgi:competence protein ComEA
VDRSKGTPPRRRLDELVAAARPPAVPPPDVVGGWVPRPPCPPGPPGPPTGDEGWDDDSAQLLEREREPESTPERVRRVLPPAAAAAALILAVAAALLVWLRSSAAGQVLDVPARTGPLVAGPSVPGSPSSLAGSTAPSKPEAPGAAPAGTSSTGTNVLIIDVEGRVRRPGLVHLPAGSRVADAVRSAGGAAPGAVLARLNLARVLTDGEQLLVPGPDDTNTPSAPAAGPGPAPGSSAPLDLNAATQEGLDALPGVGPVLAGRIVAWRTAHGRFTSVDELGEVPGIGPKALERLRPLVRV